LVVPYRPGSADLAQHDEELLAKHAHCTTFVTTDRRIPAIRGIREIREIRLLRLGDYEA
jgi:hypothetical protein